MARIAQAEMWSAEHARAITTTQEAAKYADAAGKYIRDVEDRSGRATVYAALATWSAAHTGLIADGRQADSKGVETLGEYAARLGKAQSMISRLRKVGHVLVICGLPTDPKGSVQLDDGKPFPLFQVLANKGGADKVGDDIYAMTTVTQVRDALLQHYGPDGKRLSSSPTGGRGKPRQVVAEAEDGTLTVTKPNDDGQPETVTVSPSRFAVALIQRFVEHVEAHGDQITKADQTVIARLLGQVGFVTKPVTKPRKAPARKAEAPAA